MRTMSTGLEQALKNKALVADWTPTWDLKIDPSGANLDVPDLVGLDVQGARGQRAATAVLTVANPIVTDGGETGGKYSPDRKAGTYAHVLKMGEQFRLQTGYGTDLVSTFTGLIDDVKMRRGPRDVPLLEIHARDMMVRFLKQKVRDTSQAIPAAGDPGGNTIPGMKGSRTDTPEGHFSQLAQWAGFAVGDIVTGTSLISNYKLSWSNHWNETKIATLEAACAFSAWADTDGKAHFEEIPEETTAVAVFEEGGDGTRFGRLRQINEYTLSWRNLSKWLLVVARDTTGATLQSRYEFVNTTNCKMLDNDIREYHLKGEVASQTDLDTITQRIGRRMAAGLRAVVVEGPAIPHLQIGDVIQLIESSTTASELYRIVAIKFRWWKGQSFMMDLTLVHYGAAEYPGAG